MNTTWTQSRIVSAALCTLLMTSPALAQAEVIPTITERGVCVPASVTEAHDSITNYSAYDSRPGATLIIAGFRKYPAVQMQTPEVTILFNKDTGVDARVRVRLAPLKLEDQQTLWPRFNLRCTSFVKPDKSSFKHQCDLEPALEHFGLRAFKSVLVVSFNPDRCGPRKSLLQYQVNMESDTDEVESIRVALSEAIQNSNDGLLKIAGPAMMAVFTDQRFFNKYYKGFYDGWIQSLGN